MESKQNPTNKDLKELLELLEAKEASIRYNKLDTWFPDDGPYRRELYKKHIEFITVTKDHSQVAFIAANRTGKSDTGAYLTACHLTGKYPTWWKGRKFLNAINAWCSGKTNQKTKEIAQEKLLGPRGEWGTGFIPKEDIIRITMKSGVPDAVETITVRHSSGGTSILTFKAYEQGRDGFEGTKQQLIWLDEEPHDPSIYSECYMRLADPIRPGLMICTFTPLYGLSDIVLDFLPDGQFPIDGQHPENKDKFVVHTTWDDVPHLTEEWKKNAWNAALPHEREARSKGIPSIGAGAIYPFAEDEITCAPFDIPPWWPRGYGLDTGWKCTAAVWGALDPDSGIVYIYSEHYAGEQHPAIHANAIKARGKWMTGVADAQGVNLTDGAKIFDLYTQEDLNLVRANKKAESVEAGIIKVSQFFAAGRLKIFTSCLNLLAERRTYARDEKGKIIKKKDHALDALRYFIDVGLDNLETPPFVVKQLEEYDEGRNQDEYTGY